MPVQVFARFGGPEISGSSTAKGHEGEIALLSWRFSFTPPTPSAPATTGENMVTVADQQALLFTKYVDSATTEILRLSTSGRHIESFTLMCYVNAEGPGSNSETQPFFQIHLEQVTIASYRVASNEGDVPVETVSLAYGKVTWTYNMPSTPNTPEAPQIISHDLRTHVIE